MSNAMRLGKRSLAGVAAGALGLALIPFVAVGSANAGTTIAGSVSPVRAATYGTVPEATLSWKGSGTGSVQIAQPATVVLTAWPSTAAVLSFDDSAMNLEDTATWNKTATLAANTFNSVRDDSTVLLSASVAGTYRGILGDGDDSVTFAFTTTGVPTSIELTPSTQNVLVGGVGTLTATLKDASGNVTQPATGDFVSLTQNGDDTISRTDDAINVITQASASDLASGQFEFYLWTQGAATTTVTATPQGSLPATIAGTATATVTASGTVSNTPAKSVKVTSPANAVSVPKNTDDTSNRAVAVPVGTSAVTITIDDTTANAAGQQLRFKLTPSAGAVTVGSSSGSSSAALFVDVTTDANRQATIAATLSGGALLAGAHLDVKQVNVTNNDVGVGAGVRITQTSGTAVLAVSPDDSVVAKLGDSVPVTVTVTDQFGAPQAGWIVRAFRGDDTSTGTFLNQATTDSSGNASVSVSALAGSTAPKLEKYSFSATPTIGTAAAANNALQVTYTADGTIESLTVRPAPATNPATITNTTTTITTAPLITVPFDGTANTTTGQTYTVSNGLPVGSGTAGEVAQFRVEPSTKTPVTAQVPIGSTGIFVSDTASTLWSAGKTTVTVGADDTVYVFGTKVGEHNITFTAGGKTVTAKVKVQTSAAAAYNMALSPASQSITAGGIGTATLTVTDVFGNPVQTTDDTGAVRISASGEVLLAGYDTSKDFTTNASGEATVTIIAGNAAGTGTLAATPKTGQQAPAWNTGYTKPAGAPDPTTSAAATVTVSTSPTARTIVIVGERTTVKGAAGIAVDGLTTGFADGEKVKPFVRFPGGSYTEGSARPAVEGDEFYWERKTGKKTYVYFTAENDESVKSNRIIIPAK